MNLHVPGHIFRKQAGVNPEQRFQKAPVLLMEVSLHHYISLRGGKNKIDSRPRELLNLSSLSES